MIAKYVLQHQAYHFRRVVPVILMSALILAIPLMTFNVVEATRTLSEKPLDDLNAQLILQKERSQASGGGFKTTGLVEPFTLSAFSKTEISQFLSDQEEVDRFSTTLLLWKLDIDNTLVFAGIDLEEPETGIRNVVPILLPEGRMFSGNGAREILLERHFSALFGYKVGMTFTVADVPLTIVGLVDFKGSSNINSVSGFLPYETAVRLNATSEPIVNQVFITVGSSSQIDSLSKKLSERFPDMELVTKDVMYKNLSAYNRFIYEAGTWAMYFLIPLTILMLIWLLRLYQKEDRIYMDTLQLIGWPKRYLLVWRASDVMVIVALAAILAVGTSLTLESQLFALLDRSVVVNTGLVL